MGAVCCFIDAGEVNRAVERPDVEACIDPHIGLEQAFAESRENEKSPIGKAAFYQLIENAKIAEYEIEWIVNIRCNAAHTKSHVL